MVGRHLQALLGAVALAFVSAGCAATAEEDADEDSAALSSESHLSTIRKCIADSNEALQSLTNVEDAPIEAKKGTACVKRANTKALKRIERVLVQSGSARAGTAGSTFGTYRDANAICAFMLDAHSVGASYLADASLAGCHRNRETTLGELVAVYADLGGGPARVSFDAFSYACDRAFEDDRTAAGNDETAIADAVAGHATCIENALTGRIDLIVERITRTYGGRDPNQVRADAEARIAAAISATNEVCATLTDAGYLRGMRPAAVAGALASCRRDGANALALQVDDYLDD